MDYILKEMVTGVFTVIGLATMYQAVKDWQAIGKDEESLEQWYNRIKGD